MPFLYNFVGFQLRFTSNLFHRLRLEALHVHRVPNELRTPGWVFVLVSFLEPMVVFVFSWGGRGPVHGVGANGHKLRSEKDSINAGLSINLEVSYRKHPWKSLAFRPAALASSASQYMVILSPRWSPQCCLKKDMMLTASATPVSL